MICERMSFEFWSQEEDDDRGETRGGQSGMCRSPVRLCLCEQEGLVAELMGTVHGWLGQRLTRAQAVSVTQ
jgi:hypothetical protein